MYVAMTFVTLPRLQVRTDGDPDDRAVVERVIREEGPEIAMCRTGSALTRYKADFPEMDRFPDLAWWASQAPSSWPR
jgi:hypothetical protein